MRMEYYIIYGYNCWSELWSPIRLPALAVGSWQLHCRHATRAFHRSLPLGTHAICHTEGPQITSNGGFRVRITGRVCTSIAGTAS